MKKYSYIGISFIVLIFGIIVFPKIMDRIENQSINDTKRLSLSDELSFIKLNGEKRKVENFLFLNQDSLLIGNEDFQGKSLCCGVFLYKMPLNMH
jgi:protein SCO1/2